MPWLGDVTRVSHAWYSGEQFGPALAGLLYGDVEPVGQAADDVPEVRSPTPRPARPRSTRGCSRTGQRPALRAAEIRQVDYTEGLQVGYKWYDEQDIDPLFEFGYGLSYTSFEYSDLKVEHASDAATGTSRRPCRSR